MENSFLDYAMSVIMSRALPDVRDGLKPVHRRIIWDMEQQGFRPDRPFVKCARVTGDTMARYHPHGDGAIYDALVRMAQPFSLRHPLIDFHGNYGSPDFGPAAERYTECRLHPLAMQLLADIDEDTVDMVPNYDGTHRGAGRPAGAVPEPARQRQPGHRRRHGHEHPAAQPRRGHRRHDPPDRPPRRHARRPDAVRQGPGLPDRRQHPRPGRDHRRLPHRPRQREDAGHGDDRGEQAAARSRSSSPSCRTRRAARRSPARIQELVDGGDLDGIADVNDASSGGKTELVITLKRDANANVVLNNLFKLTQLQTSFADQHGRPRRRRAAHAQPGAGARRATSRHQVEVITRRSQFRLDKARDREHILEGRIKALDVIDEIIALIRASDDAAAAKAGLMAEPFEFTEVQAVDILDMQLRQLTRLSPHRPRDRARRRARARSRELEAILADDALLRSVIKDELLGDQGGVRHAARVPDHARRRRDVDRGPRRRQGARRRDDRGAVRQGRAGRRRSRPRAAAAAASAAAKLKADDLVRHVIFTTAHAHLLFFSNRGKVYRLRALEIPERERTAKGMPIVNLLPLQPGETIQAIIDTRDFAGERFLFFATRKGTVKKTAFDAYDSSRRDGLIAINLRDGDELVRVIETGGGDDIFMVSREGMTIRFNEDDVRPMGRAAAGVRGMKLRAGDEVVSRRRRPRRHARS